MQLQFFEHLIHFEKIFHNSVFGYRKCPGCLTVLFALTEQWKEDLDSHNIIGTIATDLSKAFHCLPHDVILEKLKFYGLNTVHQQCLTKQQNVLVGSSMLNILLHVQKMFWVSNNIIILLNGDKSLSMAFH